MSERAWPTDRLTSAEQRLSTLLAAIDHWQELDADLEWVLNDARQLVRLVVEDVEAAAEAAEALERAAGRPPMSKQQAIADITDRLSWGARPPSFTRAPDV